MTTKFKLGDIVRLRSETQTMTVVHLGPDGTVHVAWIDESGKRNKPEDGMFPPEALELVPPDDESEVEPLPVA